MKTTELTELLTEALACLLGGAIVLLLAVVINSCAPEPPPIPSPSYCTGVCA